MSSRKELTSPGRWVIKIGSAVLTDDGRGLNHALFDSWVADIAAMKARGYEVVIVSSGAVAEGLVRLGKAQRPVKIHELQAAAAVGQMGLIQAWESAFQKHGLQTAQILLTHDDLADRRRYLNARRTLQELINLNVVPIINENDTVVTDEIRFGDNDTLGALVANLMEADNLIILTDRDGLYRGDPKLYPDAELVHEARAGDPVLDTMAGSSKGHLGRGGMHTKINAAKLAARSGANTILANGRVESILTMICEGASVGTILTAATAPVKARKQWLAGQLQVRGTLVVDQGAAAVLTQQGRSLLPVGVVEVRGEFERGELVSCEDESGLELARGLVNYDAGEARRIKGMPSKRIIDILGYCDDEEFIHRNNLVLM
jgi:glutamate 5-kinase